MFDLRLGQKQLKSEGQTAQSYRQVTALGASAQSQSLGPSVACRARPEGEGQGLKKHLPALAKRRSLYARRPAKSEGIRGKEWL